jgi:hypothetical protein
MTATQGSIIAANGSAQVVSAPCTCEAIEIWSTAHSFTFQYTDPNVGDVPVGGVLTAEAISATDFKIRIDGPRSQPWPAGTKIGIVIGTNGDSLYVNSRRAN